METFLDSRRLLNGPWQAFERDVARLLVANSFDDVRIVGGSGDKGADVLGVKGGELWVIQCKFVTNQYPSAFRRGNLDVVTTRDLFNEGVDVPDVDMIAFMRVTHSRRIFVQQLGRGLRISPNKDKVVVLDFVSDLKRIAEVIELERAVKGDIETLRLGGRLVQFRDVGASNFMLDWMKDQADLFNREGDPTLELPRFEYPETGPRGNVQ